MDLFQLTETLIRIESITGNERAIVRFLQEYLTVAGFTVHLQEVAKERHNLFAFIEDPILVFSTHVDTVSPSLAFHADQDFLYGRGACDAKGSLSAMIRAAELLVSDHFHSIGLLFLVGEERDSEGARCANTLSNRCRYLIGGEPTENKLAIGSKGAIRFELKTFGKSAHSAYPEQGESAVEKLLDILERFRRMSFPSHPILGKTTINIGKLFSDSPANVIPDYASAELMMRTVQDVEEVKALIQPLIGENAEVEYRFACNPMLFDVPSGFETTVVAFTTDLPLLSAWGKPFLLGPGSILDAHTPHEKIAKAELEKAVHLYVQLAKQLLQAGKGVQ